MTIKYDRNRMKHNNPLKLQNKQEIQERQWRSMAGQD